MRYPDWETRLDDYLLANRGAQFQYAVSDCCTFALGGVKAITGHDFASPYREYSTYKSGYQMIREKYGKKTLKSFLEFVLIDLPFVPKGFQQRGDLVLIERGVKSNRNRYALGIVSLSGVPIVMDSIGYRVMSNESVLRGWRV
jgi:hypothetical protein